MALVYAVCTTAGDLFVDTEPICAAMAHEASAGGCGRMFFGASRPFHLHGAIPACLAVFAAGAAGLLQSRAIAHSETASRPFCAPIG